MTPPRPPALGRFVAWAQHSGPRFGATTVLIVACVFLGIALPDRTWSLALLAVLAGLTAVAAVWAAAERRRVVAIVAVAVAGLIALAAALAAAGAGSWVLVLVNLVLLVTIGGALLRGVRHEHEVNTQTVFAALSLYLLLGLAFAWLVTLSAHAQDAPYFAQGTDGTRSERVYFSFVTLATLGYGDLTPAVSLGRALAVLEALLGSLYLVTIVAVVVSRLRPRGAAE